MSFATRNLRSFNASMLFSSVYPTIDYLVHIPVFGSKMLGMLFWGVTIVALDVDAGGVATVWEMEVKGAAEVFKGIGSLKAGVEAYFFTYYLTYCKIVGLSSTFNCNFGADKLVKGEFEMITGLWLMIGFTYSLGIRKGTLLISLSLMATTFRV